VSWLRRAVFVDRDGVLNEAIVRNGKPRSPLRLQEVVIPDGVPEALRALKKAGFVLICVTNQPDVARGIQRREAVEAINAALVARLPLDGILVCYHDDQDGCSCRKPQPGLILQAAGEHTIDLRRSFVIGDRWRDIEAGRQAGCLTIRLQRHYTEQEPETSPDYVSHSLTEAASWILSRDAP